LSQPQPWDILNPAVSALDPERSSLGVHYRYNAVRKFA